MSFAQNDNASRDLDAVFYGLNNLRRKGALRFKDVQNKTQEILNHPPLTIEQKLDIEATAHRITIVD